MKQQQISTRAAPAPIEMAKAGRSPRTTLAVGSSSPAVSGNGHDELIRERAYFLYEARQREGGHELDDWLQAEAQICQQVAAQQGSSTAV